MEILFDQPHTPQTIGAIRTRHTIDEIGAPRAETTIGEIRRCMARLATTGMREIAAVRAVLAMGALVTVAQVLREHARSTRHHVCGIDASGARRIVLVSSGETLKLGKKLDSIHPNRISQSPYGVK